MVRTMDDFDLHQSWGFAAVSEKKGIALHGIRVDYHAEEIHL